MSRYIKVTMVYELTDTIQPRGVDRLIGRIKEDVGRLTQSPDVTTIEVLDTEDTNGDL